MGIFAPTSIKVKSFSSIEGFIISGLLNGRFAWTTAFDSAAACDSLGTGFCATAVDDKEIAVAARQIRREDNSLDFTVDYLGRNEVILLGLTVGLGYVSILENT